MKVINQILSSISLLPTFCPAQTVQDALICKGMKFRVIELDASTRTANEAAEAISCEIAQIVKSLIFYTKDESNPILVLASGINRVNEETIARILGQKISKADAHYVREVTGFVIGGVPPIGHKQKIKTFIDEDLLQYEEIWAAAGTPNAVFNLKSIDIQKLTDGEVISVI